VAALITGLLMAMAAFFADRRNGELQRASVEPVGVPDGAVTSPASTLDASLVARGRAVYEDQACARCHSIDGRGNPRAPLDGVGARRSVGELRDWVTAAGSVRGELSRSAQRAKDGFRQLPEADLEALVTYLASIR